MEVKIETEFEVMTCITCGIEYGLPAYYRQELRRNHRWFYCPNGHPQHYPQQTEEERLRVKLQQTEDELYQVQKERDGALDRITKMKKRANAGLCPYCRRHFVNVERHIKCKHKDKIN